MKKILLITNYNKGVGGISVQVELLHKHLLEDGYQSQIFTTKGSIIFRLFRFVNLIRIGIKYDVFHIHGCSFLGFYPIILGVSIGKLLNKTLIVTYHGGDADEFFRKYPRFVRFFLTKTNFNIVLSGYLASVFKKYTIPYTIVPNILDFKKDPFKKRKILEPKYISVRTLSELYNIELILLAFKKVLEHFPKASLTIVGDGPCRKDLEQLVFDQSINNVLFTGKVDNELIYKYLDSSDVLVSAPRIDNQPVSILEAYNAGLVVVSSNVGGVPYMLEDNITGYLFENNNQCELVDKMMMAVENNQQSLAIIERAKKQLVNYTWVSIKEKLLILYK